MLRSDLFAFSDVYIVVKGTINVINPDNNVYDKKNYLLRVMNHLFQHFKN